MRKIQRTCILVMLTCLGLASVPVALGTYVFGEWLPEQIRRSQAERQIEHARQQTRRNWQRIEQLRQCIEQVKRLGDRPPPWAPRRATYDVLDRVGRCFGRCGAELRELRSDEPVLCGVASREDVLAADPVTLQAVGPYEALTRALDDVASAGVPLRVEELDWTFEQGQLRLTLKAKVAFCADEALRGQLAGAAAMIEALEAADEP